MTFSVVIPTRNERDDIPATLDALVAQTRRADEIIVVDDSTDDTREVVATYFSRLPELRLHGGSSRGRCAARNIGITESTSDVVIVLNADVLLPSDFIERLIPHYEGGTDFVLVNAQVANAESLIAAYIGAQSIATYGDQSLVNWTEGFSCRRQTLIDCGMFPITPMPLVAGEDGPVGQRLRKVANRTYDAGLTVQFIAPSDLKSFWRTYKERAYPLAAIFLLNRSLASVVLRNIGKLIWRITKAVTVLPNFVYAQKLAGVAPGTRPHTSIVFFALKTLQDAAYIAGDWEGLSKYLRWRARNAQEQV